MSRTSVVLLASSFVVFLVSSVPAISYAGGGAGGAAANSTAENFGGGDVGGGGSSIFVPAMPSGCGDGTLNDQCATNPTPPSPPGPSCIDNTSTYCGVNTTCNSCSGQCTVSGSYNASLPGCSNCPNGFVWDQTTQTCVQPGSCPSGFHWNASTNRCDPNPQCTGGTVYNPQTGRCDICSNGSPPDPTTGRCTVSRCPTSYTYNSQTGLCEPPRCTPAQNYYQCGTGAHAGDLDYVTFDSSCTQTHNYTPCDLGCSDVTHVCVTPPSGTTADIRARPSLVRSGNTSMVTWAASGVSYCVIRGGIDSWNCTGPACTNGSHQSSPITVQTTYALTCRTLTGDQAGANVTINIAPVFQEQ